MTRSGRFNEYCYSHTTIARRGAPAFNRTFEGEWLQREIACEPRLYSLRRHHGSFERHATGFQRMPPSRRVGSAPVIPT